MKVKIRELLEDRQRVCTTIDTISHLKPSGMNGYSMLHITQADANKIAEMLTDYADMIDAIIDSAEATI